MGELLQEWHGFKRGQEVTTLVETKGADFSDTEYTMPAGAEGFIDDIERYDNDQGVVVTVVIKTSSDDPESYIVNAFDELDGPIANFIKAKETS